MNGPLTAAATQAGGRNVLLLVPGLDALTTSVQLPVRRQSRVEQMLPYTLEDTVAADVDTLLFAAGSHRADGQIPVAVVARERMDTWLEQCAEAGLQADAIYVDVQGVPETPGNLTLLLEGEKIYGRLPEREPFVFVDLDLEDVVDILRTETDPSVHLDNVVIYADDAGYSSHERELERVRDKATIVDVNVLADGLLPRLAATFIAESGSNLLQGPYRPKSNWNELLQPWRTPAILVGALFIAVALVKASLYVSLSREDDALTAMLESGCQAAFATNRLSACEAEIQDRLATTGDGVASASDSTFLDTLYAVATVRNDETLLQAMSFRDGVTNLRVVAPDVQALDALAQGLGGEGRFQANIQSATPGDSGVEGRLQIAELNP
jgi:general secretion pathway protein L